jgi:muconolactone delta-isomerase
MQHTRTSERDGAMEYFVEMTTQVPAGTSEDTVADIRTREATRAGELAAGGHLLRLWRPPLAPGEWRTFGVFAAGDDAQLDSLLSSMPLHVWRTDTVTPLAKHPNDPGATRGAKAAEFLTMLTIVVPDGSPAETVAELKVGEAHRAKELAGEGRLVRLWTPPAQDGQWRTLGVWSADDETGLTATLQSLPLYPWMAVVTTPLHPHPSDPAGAS